MSWRPAYFLPLISGDPATAESGICPTVYRISGKCHNISEIC